MKNVHDGALKSPSTWASDEKCCAALRSTKLFSFDEFGAFLDG